MSDDPLKLMLDRLDAIIASNAETRKVVADMPQAVSAAAETATEPVTKALTAQGRAFTDMQVHHDKTLKEARAAPAWAVTRAVLYVTAGLAVLVLAAGLVLQATGQVHIVIGPAAGFCATPPIEQPNGGQACWQTPPPDEEDAKRLEACLEPSFVSRSQGRRACWLDPPSPKPVPEQDG